MSCSSCSNGSPLPFCRPPLRSVNFLLLDMFPPSPHPPPPLCRDWATKQYVRNFTYPFGRFCSADLPEQRALLYKGVYGTKEKIFMNGGQGGGDPFMVMCG